MFILPVCENATPHSIQHSTTEISPSFTLELCQQLAKSADATKENKNLDQDSELFEIIEQRLFLLRKTGKELHARAECPLE